MIAYYLVGSTGQQVSVNLRIDELRAQLSFLCLSVSGDVGSVVEAGTGRTMTWNARDDLGRVATSNARVRIVASDTMCFVPPGTFLMGDTNQDGESCPGHSHEQPARYVFVNGFGLDRFEVSTNVPSHAMGLRRKEARRDRDHSHKLGGRSTTANGPRPVRMPDQLGRQCVRHRRR